MSGRVMVFGPGAILTVTVEAPDGEPDVHLHAGGQGVWQARMIASLDVPVVLCANLGGEAGQVLRPLIAREGVTLHAVEGRSRSGAYVHDRRSGRRIPIAEAPGDPLSRHELDELYNLALVEGLEAQVCLLAGPADQRVIPGTVYQRLSSDLVANGRTVIADLSGALLDAVLEGQVTVLKVSHEELIADGRAESHALVDLVAAIEAIRRKRVEVVVVSRAHEPALASFGGEIFEVVMPKLHPVEPRGAGDCMTAGIAAALSRGESIESALRIGAAAGALNVTRAGLGTGERAAIERLAAQIRMRPLADLAHAGSVVKISPRELARRTELP